MANAADEEKVREAGARDRHRRKQELSDLRAVLGTDAGKRVLWRFLCEAGIFQSIWEPSAKIHYYAGKQDFGHFIQSEIVEADENALFEMMRSNKEMLTHKKEGDDNA